MVVVGFVRSLDEELHSNLREEGIALAEILSSLEEELPNHPAIWMLMQILDDGGE